MKTKETRETFTEIELDGNDIVNFLKDAGIIDLACSPRVCFRVPSGGDWSGMDVDVSKEDSIKIRFNVVETEGDLP